MPKKGTAIDTSTLDAPGSNTAATLLQHIETIASLEDEKADVSERIKDEYARLKSTGFDAKIARKIVARMKRDAAEVEEEDSLIETYERALEVARTQRQF
jgi:uncharacterized protein (UPF0335 family)